MSEQSDENNNLHWLEEIVEQDGNYELVSCGICGKTLRRKTTGTAGTFDRLPDHWADEDRKCPGGGMKRKEAIDIFFIIQQRIEGIDEDDEG